MAAGEGGPHPARENERTPKEDLGFGAGLALCLTPPYTHPFVIGVHHAAQTGSKPEILLSLLLRLLRSQACASMLSRKILKNKTITQKDVAVTIAQSAESLGSMLQALGSNPSMPSTGHSGTCKVILN